MELDGKAQGFCSGKYPRDFGGRKSDAFAKPVDGKNKGLMLNSLEALTNYWNSLLQMYGSAGITACYATLESTTISLLDQNGESMVNSVTIKKILDQTMSALEPNK